MIKKIPVLLVIVIVVTLFLGCSASESTDPIALVPQRANMLGHINLSEILQDKELTGIYDRALENSENPQTVKGALDNLKDENGIDLRDFQGGIFFADLSDSSIEESGYSGAIVRGTFDTNKLIDSIKEASENGIIVTEYKGYTIYSYELEEMAFVFVGNYILVIGPMDVVKDVIDVKKGDKKAVGGKVLDNYNKLGDVLVKIAAEVPADVAKERLEDSEDELPADLSSFADIRTIGLSMTKKQQSIALNLQLCAVDSDSAEAIEQTIEGMLAFIQLLGSFSDDPEAAEGLLSPLEDLNISRSGSCVTINLDMTFSEIEGLIAEGLGQLE